MTEGDAYFDCCGLSYCKSCLRSGAKVAYADLLALMFYIMDSFWHNSRMCCAFKLFTSE